MKVTKQKCKASPSIGMQYARIAMRNLDDITNSDLELVEALQTMKGYCDGRLAKSKVAKK